MELKQKDNKKKQDIILEEEEIIRHVRKGDKDSFRFLVERYEGRVYGLARRMLGDHHDAEDVCQETFVRAFKSLAGFDTRYPFVNWLLTITTNLGRRCIKQRVRFRIQSFPEYGVGGPERPMPHDTRDNMNALHNAISEALDRLSERRRTAFLLLQQSSRSYAEIAEIMGIPIGTVKTEIHRSRLAIQQHLSACGLLES